MYAGMPMQTFLKQATGMLWAVVIPEMAAGRKRAEGDGFIDSVFTAIMQMSSTIIPKYIESGFGHHPKERLSEFPNIGIL